MRLGWDRVVALDPFDAAAHSGSGRLALKGKRRRGRDPRVQGGAAHRRRRQGAAHCDLGEAYLLAGAPADAKKEALAALEIAPTFERAQDLLLRAVEGKVTSSVRRR